MPDIFHINIEDRQIAGELIKYIEDTGYIHFADSNRKAPGQGHIDLFDIMKVLKSAGCSGRVTVEILPLPEPFMAAKQAMDFLKPMILEYNHK